MTKRAGEAILGDLVQIITKHLKKGERVRIAGLGILQVRKRAALMGGHNPATGEAIKIKASKKVAFRWPQAAKDVFVQMAAVERAGLSNLNEGQLVEYEEVANRAKNRRSENLKVQR